MRRLENSAFIKWSAGIYASYFFIDRLASLARLYGAVQQPGGLDRGVLDTLLETAYGGAQLRGWLVAAAYLIAICIMLHPPLELVGLSALLLAVAGIGQIVGIPYLRDGGELIAVLSPIIPLLFCAKQIEKRSDV